MAETEPPKGGKGKGGFEKHKWWYLGGGAAFLVVLFLVYRSNQSSNAAASNTASTTDPLTGLPSGTPADNAALAAMGQGSQYYPVGTSGTTGATGPAGPAGPAGPQGPAGSGGGGSTGVVWTGGNPPRNPVTMPGGGGAAAHSSSNSYVVQPTDSLGSIAGKTGSSPGAIMAANQHILGSGPLHAGQKLVVP